MATEITTKHEIDFYNNVEVHIKSKQNIEAPDMKIIGEAIDTIIDTMQKYYPVTPPVIKKGTL